MKDDPTLALAQQVLELDLELAKDVDNDPTLSPAQRGDKLEPLNAALIRVKQMREGLHGDAYLKAKGTSGLLAELLDHP